MNETGLKKFFCGPESFTPDGMPIVGEAAELRNYYCAAGLNSLGILTSGGIGKLLAHWIKDGKAPNDIDIMGIDIRRFQKVLTFADSKRRNPIHSTDETELVKHLATRTNFTIQTTVQRHVVVSNNQHCTPSCKRREHTFAMLADGSHQLGIIQMD